MFTEQFKGAKQQASTAVSTPSSWPHLLLFGEKRKAKR